MRKMVKASTFLNLDGFFADGSSAVGQKGSLSGKWPDWAKAFSFLGILLILLFFVDIPVQRSHNIETLLGSQQWELTETGVFWNVSLRSDDSLFIELRVFQNLQVIFYINDETGNRWLNYTAEELSQNWSVPMSGTFSINIDNPHIQERPRGTISITRYMTASENRIDYPYRWLQIGLLVVGIVLVTIGLSAYQRLARRNGAVGILPARYEKRCWESI